MNTNRRKQRRHAHLITGLVAILTLASCATPPPTGQSPDGRGDQTTAFRAAPPQTTTTAPPRLVEKPLAERRSARVSDAYRDRKRAKIARKLAGKPKPKTNAPSERFRERSNDRRGNDGRPFEFQQLLTAVEQAETMPELQLESSDPRLRDAGIWNWEWLGPDNVGGRVRALAVHPTLPNRLWAGAASGGIWRSPDAGQSWFPVSDFLPSLAISSIVIDPSNPNTMYAGSGESFANGATAGPPGAGIYKSTNGGFTWNQLAATETWQYVNELAISPDGQVLLAARQLIRNGGYGIRRSTDGGQTWNLTSLDTPRVLDVKFHPTDSNKAIAGGVDGNAWYSIDGGQTWNDAFFAGSPGITQLSSDFVVDGNNSDETLSVTNADAFSPFDRVEIGSGASEEIATVTSVDRTNNQITVTDLDFSHGSGSNVRSLVAGRVELAYAPSNPNIVFASMNAGRGTVWRSTNGGQSFFTRSNTIDDYLGGQGNYNNTIWVAPDDADLVVVAGVQAFRSTNGGSSLALIGGTTGFENGNAAHVDFHTIVAPPNYSSSNRKVYFTNDGGVQANANILTAGAFTGWSSLSANGLGCTQFFGGAATPDGAYIIGGTQDNDTLHMDAGGWYFGEFLFDGGKCAIDYSDPGNPIFYKESQFLGFRRSTNLGLTYTPAINGLTETGAGNARFVAPFRMAPPNSLVLLAGAQSLFLTVNGASTWFPIRNPTGDLCSAVAFAPTDSNIAWAGYQDGKVSRTAGGLLDWVDVDTADPGNPLPNRTVTSIAVSPLNPQQAFVTFGGFEADNVWYTPDNGSTWEQRTGSGAATLPSVHISSIVYHPFNPDWVYIGTDIGVFASDDRGLTWGRTARFGQIEGPVNVEIGELFWQGSYLIAATFGRGMYRVRPLQVIYVDQAHVGAEDGTFAFPYDTVQEGIAAAGPPATISIRAGTYDEAGTTTFNKRGRVVATDGSVFIR